jgi:hypothetical protein
MTKNIKRERKERKSKVRVEVIGFLVIRKYPSLIDYRFCVRMLLLVTYTAEIAERIHTLKCYVNSLVLFHYLFYALILGLPAKDLPESLYKP